MSSVDRPYLPYLMPEPLQRTEERELEDLVAKRKIKDDVWIRRRFSYLRPSERRNPAIKGILPEIQLIPGAPFEPDGQEEEKVVEDKPRMKWEAKPKTDEELAAEHEVFLLEQEKVRQKQANSCWAEELALEEQTEEWRQRWGSEK